MMNIPVVAQHQEVLVVNDGLFTCHAVKLRITLWTNLKLNHLQIIRLLNDPFPEPINPYAQNAASSSVTKDTEDKEEKVRPRAKRQTNQA